MRSQRVLPLFDALQQLNPPSDTQAMERLIDAGLIKELCGAASWPVVDGVSVCHLLYSSDFDFSFMLASAERRRRVGNCSSVLDSREVCEPSRWPYTVHNCGRSL